MLPTFMAGTESPPDKQESNRGVDGDFVTRREEFDDLPHEYASRARLSEED